jgi:RNA polymerase sigma factor for flagellar operon FliA
MSTLVSKHAHREDVVHEHIQLVRTIARRLAHRLPPSVEVDELVNIGTIGLLDARDRFDPDRGVSFRTYAELRIKGQMIDALRRNDWVPRSARKKRDNLDHTREQLARRLGRAPTLDEVRAELGMRPEAFERYCSDANLRHLTSLDTPTGEEANGRVVDHIASEEDTAAEQLVRQEIRSEVARAVERLPPKERVVVTMSYLDDLTLREIGQKLGITESRVCQLRGQGLKRLRFRLRAV